MDAVATGTPGEDDDLIDRLIAEGLVTLGAAARRMFASRVNRTTICRWIHRGSRTLSGNVVKLEAVKVGATWFTSHQAFKRYVSEVNAR